MLEFIKNNWWYFLIALFLGFSIYTNDLAQTAQLAKHEQRITALEDAKADNQTKWAVLQIQLTAIQTDLTDIKTQLKSK